MSSISSNANLYEVIGRLTVWTQSLESDNSALRAELSENATYIASLESRVEELLRNPPAAARPRWETQRPPLSHRCNRPEAYPCYEDPYYDRMMTEEEPPSIPQSGTVRVGAFGGGVPQRETSYGEVFAPERQVADCCATCGHSVYQGDHSNCGLPQLVRQVADTRGPNPSFFRKNDFEKYAAEDDMEIAEEDIIMFDMRANNFAVPSHVVDEMRIG